MSRGTLSDTDITEFDTKDILPKLVHKHEAGLYVLTSLHYGEQIFGYAVSEFSKVEEISVDGTFTSWCDAAEANLNQLQKHLYRDYLYQQSEALSMYDTETGLLNRRGLKENLSDFRKSSDVFCLMSAQIGNKNSVISDTLMIANALRLSAKEKELLCRINRRTYIVVFPSKDDNAENYTQKRSNLLYDKLHYFYESNGFQNIPKLLTESIFLPFEGISKTEQRLIDCEAAFADKVSNAGLSVGNYNDSLKSLRRHIYSAPQEEWTVDRMAAELNISTSHMQRVYKKEFGVSCITDIITARTEYAKELLLSTNLKIHEIASRCGYANANHFMRQFKTEVGMSATQFRKKSFVD